MSGGPGRMLLELFDREKLVVGPMLHRAQAFESKIHQRVRLALLNSSKPF